MEERPKVFRISSPGSPTRFNRRDFLKVAGASAAGFLAARCVPAATPTPTEVPPAPTATPTSAPVPTPTEVPAPEIGGVLNLITWEGWDNAEGMQPFYDEYGVTVNFTAIGSNDEVLTKYRAGGPGTYDVTGINNRYYIPAAEEGIFIPLDLSRIPNYEDLYPAFKEVPFARYKGEIYGITAFFGFDVINYNADLTDPPDTWFFHRDAKYAGKWGLLDNPAGTMMLWGTILGHGADSSQYTHDILAEIVEFGKECVASAKTILKSYGEMQDLLTRGDIIVAYTGWEAVTVWSKKAGTNLQHCLPPEAAKCWADGYAIFNGAPNPDTAYAWVNYAISAEALAIAGMNAGSLVSNSKSAALMDPENPGTLDHTGVEEALKAAQYSKFPPKEPEDPYISMDELFEGWEEIMAG